MAQLNTLEEMQKLNDNLVQLTMTQGLLQGSNLIGKWVKAAGARRHNHRGAGFLGQHVE